MAVDVADIITNGLPVVGAINTFLTGVVRREFVVMEFTDYAGNTSQVQLQIEPAFGGGPVFDILDVDLLAAINDIVPLSDAELNAIEFVSELRDHTPSTPGVDSNVKEVGILTFSIPGGSQRSVKIPSVSDALVVESGGNALDATLLADAAAQFTGEGLTTRTFVLDNRQANKMVAQKRTTYKTRQKRI